jgi:hypothetical protein
VPPIETTDSDISAPKQVLLSPTAKRHFILVLGVSMVIILCSVVLVLYFFIHPRIQSLTEEIKNDSVNSIKTFSVLKYFPNFDGVTIKSDSTDSQYIWLFGQMGIVRMNVHSFELEDYSQKIPDIENKIISDVVRVNDTLFIGFQGGVLKYDMQAETSIQYTQADGLASDSNVSFTTDSSNSDILWISTIEGVTMMSISTGHMQSFSNEMGIVGTAWEPYIFHIDQKYVWATVSSNSYTTGGVARFDKQTGIWKAWNNEKFHFGIDSSRSHTFDTRVAAADGDRVIVEEDDLMYVYNQDIDEWRPVTNYHASSYNNGVILKGNIAYLYGQELLKLNIDTGEVRNLLEPEMFLDTSITYKNFIDSYPVIQFDSPNNRLILYPRNLSTKVGIGILSLVTKEISLIPFKNIQQSFDLINTTLLDARNNHIVLNTESGLVDYDLSKNTLQTLLPHMVSVAKIIGDDVVAIIFDECGDFCDVKSLVNTASIISLKTARVTSEAILTGINTHTYFVGDTISDVYLAVDTYSHINTKKWYQLDVSKKQFVALEEKNAHIGTPVDMYGNHGERVTASNKSGEHSVSFDLLQIGDSMSVFVKNPNGDRAISIPVGPEDYDFFSTYHDIQILNYTFDPSNQNIFWIGSDRGLLRLDMNAFTYRVFTTDDGLASNKILKITPMGDTLVVQHEGGVYLYHF